MNFKNILLFPVTLFVLAFTFSACEDSLGLEDNYKQWQINIDPHLNDTTMPVEILSTLPSFVEYYPSNINPDSVFIKYPWGIYISKYSYITPRVDSLNGKYYVWLSMSVLDTADKDIHRDRDDRITWLQIYADSIPVIQTQNPDTLKYSGLWSAAGNGKYSSVQVNYLVSPYSTLYFSYLNSRTSFKVYKMKKDIEVDGKIENLDVIEIKILVNFSYKDPVKTSFMIGYITILI